MLHDLPFEGTIKVRNKGVDIAILTDSDFVDTALAATRSLVVCGISTAVLEATCLDPIDERTLGYYEETTRVIVATSEKLYDSAAAVMKNTKKLRLFRGSSQKELIATVRCF
ncbi:MAG: hypothetical protein MJ117_00615 [Lachnospiraceae bacterium]|nr:hypothetical protein [Lachnospiraceae bacterium]